MRYVSTLQFRYEVEIGTHQQLLCKAKGIIFKNRMAALTAKFQAATGGFLSPGMKVLLQVKANFNVLHGLSLHVEDIDRIPNKIPPFN